MELRHLRYFIAVAEDASFTRAARRLHTAQPSLSRQIRDLERIVGTPLLTRSSRHVALTDAGQVFLDEARLVIAQAQRAIEQTRQTAHAQDATLGVGFIPGVEVDELQRVMEALEAGARPTQILLRSQSSPLLIAALHDRQLDVAFVRPSRDCAGLEQRVIRRERLIVAMPAGHRLAQRASVALEALVDEPLIDVTARHAPVLFEIIEAYAAAHAIRLVPRYQAENLMMALSLISTMGGICLVPEHASPLFPAGVIGVPFTGEAPTITLALAWHPANRAPALSDFLTRFERVV